MNEKKEISVNEVWLGYNPINWYQQKQEESGAMCNMGYLSETHLKLKSRKISFIHNSHSKFPIVLKFCTEHGSTTVVLCAKFHNNWTIKMGDMDERNFTRFEFKMHFRRMSHTAHTPDHNDMTWHGNPFPFWVELIVTNNIKLWEFSLFLAYDMLNKNSNCQWFEMPRCSWMWWVSWNVMRL